MRRARFSVISVCVISLVLVSFGSIASAAGTFNDDDGSVHESAIESIAAAGITKGCNPPANTNYCPNRSVTRAEMATFLTRAFDLPSGGSAGFADTAGSVHAGAIDALAASGITKGCNPPANTNYCPDAPVTRGQMATFLTRAMGLSTGGGDDLFDDDNTSVHEDDIDRLGTAGVTKGCNPPANTNFCPDAAVTRAEMATFLMRATGLRPISPEPPTGPSEEGAALVSRFSVTRIESDRTIPNWVRNMGYWPRSFKPGLDVNGVPGNEGWQVDRVDDAAEYHGWDALSPANSWGFNDYVKNDKWMSFTLNRPARVAVVWRDTGPRPGWLQSGWTQGGTVQIDGQYAPVFERDYPAGKVNLGTVEGSAGNGKTMYVILLAESNGNPTPAPAVPTGRTAPKVGGPCPTWVHDRHTTKGPDGKNYHTWHPQWDPVYWCSFGHDHGSNPALIPGSPMVPYGYVADKNQEDESNVGFKEFIFKDLSARHWVRFVVHAGSVGQKRVCTQFHTLYVQVYDLAGEELMNVGFKADYGDPVAVRDGGDLGPGCPENIPGYDNSNRARLFNVNGIEHDYERWRSMANTTATRNLGFGDFHHAFDIRDPMDQCTDLVCNSMLGIGDTDSDNGTRRTLDMSAWRDSFSFNVAQALGTGEFYTDPYGLQKVSASAQNAVRQYIDPAVQSTDFLINEDVNRIMCTTADPWTMFYGCIELKSSTPFPHADDMQIQCSIVNN